MKDTQCKYCTNYKAKNKKGLKCNIHVKNWGKSTDYNICECGRIKSCGVVGCWRPHLLAVALLLPINTTFLSRYLYLSIYPYMFLYICISLSIYLSIYLYTYLSIYVYVYLSLYLRICLISFYLSINTTFLFRYLYLSIYTFICLFISLCRYL